MDTSKYEATTIYLEIPQSKWDDFLEIAGCDLFRNESWALDYSDFRKYEKLFKTVMTDELYNRLVVLFLTGQKRYIELLRDNYK